MATKKTSNISKNFNILKDVDIDLRLKYYYAFTDFMQYKIDKTKATIDYTYLN